MIVALSGRAGTGKDTCARWLERECGARVYHFADPLKRMAMEVFGWDDWQVFGTQEQKEHLDQTVRRRRPMTIIGCACGSDRGRNECPLHGEGYYVTPRETLIHLGEAARRWIGVDVWARACLDQIARDFGLPLVPVQPGRAPGAVEPFAIIADCRYENEARLVRAAGGVVIRLRCPDADTKVDPDAPSERSVDAIPTDLVDAEVVAARSPGAAELLERFAEAWVRLERVRCRQESNEVVSSE